VRLSRLSAGLKDFGSQSTVGSAEDGTAGEPLGAERAGLAIAGQASCPLELGKQIEQEQHAAKGASGGEALPHARNREPPSLVVKSGF
jgi:hypothetical protein